MFEAGAVAILAPSGPFAWNPLLAFWSPVVTLFAWILIIAFQMFRTTGSQDRKRAATTALH
jgi:hypothetical protein